METIAKPTPLKRLLYPGLFFLFIMGIIYKADTANYNFAFHVVGMIPYGDKFFHAILYGIMAYLLNYGLNGKRLFRIEIGTLLVLCFAFAEEVSQLYFPSRSFDWFDLLSDAVGIFAATVVYRVKGKNEKS